MAGKTKVTVTLDKDKLRELDSIVVARDANRSALIEEALDIWQREQLRKELARGYAEMAGEDRRTAEDNLGSGLEVLD